MVNRSLVISYTSIVPHAAIIMRAIVNITLGPNILLSDVLPEAVPDGDGAPDPVGLDDDVGLGALYLLVYDTKKEVLMCT